MNDLSPVETIERLINEHLDWSDKAIIEALRKLPPLSDEAVYMNRDGDWNEIYLFLALADIYAVRKLRPAIMLLFERASFGDPGETMRGVRHSLEAIANPDWDFLADVCLEALDSKRPGTRFWAIEQLGVLHLQRTLEAVRRKLDDPESEVRAAAQSAIGRTETRN